MDARLAAIKPVLEGHLPGVCAVIALLASAGAAARLAGFSAKPSSNFSVLPVIAGSLMLVWCVKNRADFVYTLFGAISFAGRAAVGVLTEMVLVLVGWALLHPVLEFAIPPNDRSKGSDTFGRSPGSSPARSRSGSRDRNARTGGHVDASGQDGWSSHEASFQEWGPEPTVGSANRAPLRPADLVGPGEERQVDREDLKNLRGAAGGEEQQQQQQGEEEQEEEEEEWGGGVAHPHRHQVPHVRFASGLGHDSRSPSTAQTAEGGGGFGSFAGVAPAHHSRAQHGAEIPSGVSAGR